MNYVELLREGFNAHVSRRQKRPGVQKLIVPLFHEDGDMVDIFLEDLPDGRVKISDKGLSLMRLSYSYDLDTTNKDRIFRRILNENNLNEDDGMLYVDVPEDQIYPAVLHFGQAVAKVTNMAIYRREVIANLFYESLDEKIRDSMGQWLPRENVVPLLQRPELVVDYELNTPKNKIFIFGVKDKETPKLRLAAVSCLEFQKAKIPFRSVVVHQNFGLLSKTDQNIITNAADKQFTSLEEFVTSGPDAIMRLAA